ncbi:hypothetical protein [Nostoc sp. LPT]|nr:hypothetical protein [Nostoc sp. LPT]MBN4002115.1 hypothetical protein [Nostoc sp. LPT]
MSEVFRQQVLVFALFKTDQFMSSLRSLFMKINPLLSNAKLGNGFAKPGN